MYKALIADDEEIIRLGISKWVQKDTEMEIVAMAEDGEEALEKALQTLPDLMFVDINMPFLNGLEFIEKVKEHLNNVMMIIITGYDDFAFAQRAIQLGVFEYLLKPLSEEPFYEALERAKEQIKKKQQLDNKLKWSLDKIKDNNGEIVNQLIEDVIDKKITCKELQNQLQYVSLKLPKRFSTVMLRLGSVDRDMALNKGWDIGLLYYASENITYEILADYGPILTFNRGKNLVILVEKMCEEALEILKNTIRNHLGINFFITYEGNCKIEVLGEVCTRLHQQIKQQSSESYLVKELKEIIRASYGDSNLSLQTIADKMHLTPQYLSRIFKEETGETVVEYLIKMRMNKASKLLLDETLRIYEVAELSGYTSQHYFSNAFKKAYGLSPVEYKRRMKYEKV